VVALQYIKDVGASMERISSFEDFRIKVSNVEKKSEGITSTAAAIEFGTKRFL
jgi:hypothetical protein